MTWRAMSLLLVAVPGPSGSCAAGNEPVEPGERVVEPEARAVAVLSATEPWEELPVPAFERTPTALAVTLRRIDNPLSQPFSVTATLEPRLGPGSSTAIGTFTPFPPDQGGTFLLGIPAAAQARLASPAGAGVVLRLALTPIVPELPLVAPLTVAVAEPVWQ